MPNFGNRSKQKLETCDPRLQEIFETVVEKFDCSILEGHRGEERQNLLYEQGQSKLMFPQGKHNTNPSKAVDAAPYPIDWDNRERFVLFAGYVRGVADSMGYQLRWGGDWDNDWDTKAPRFFDAPHFEIVD